MPTRKSPRKGSLQFWPRKRVNKFLPSVNWKAISSGKGLKGFICYKAGMMSAEVTDNTADSMTKGKKIIMPVTVLECPEMKIFSVRFYKNGKVMKDVLVENLDKELKRKVKIPKKKPIKIEDVKDFDNVNIIVYSIVKKTNIKKTPDLIEMGLVGSVEEKINFIKENLGKDISVLDIFEKGQLVDLRGLTKGKGLSGPVKRFGINLKSHKSEKGQRRPGSLGPWHPARVTFRVPQAGQLGMFTRNVYNNKIIDMGKVDTLKGITKGHDASDKFKNIKNFGDIKTNYMVVRGSIQGSAKRALLLTVPFRETKRQSKKNFELVAIK